MEKILAILLLIFLITAIVAFLIVFVLSTAIKINQPYNFYKEFRKYQIGRYALPCMIISFLMIFILNFVINKIEREKISTELSISKTRLYINGTEIINDSLLNDIQNISKTSSERNTGSTEIKVVLESGTTVNHVKLLRSFSDSTKYWVFSQEGVNCIGEINTKHLKNY